MSIDFGRALNIVRGEPFEETVRLDNGKTVCYKFIPCKKGGKPSIFVENPVLENREYAILNAICKKENLKIEDLEGIGYNRQY